MRRAAAARAARGIGVRTINTVVLVIRIAAPVLNCVRIAAIAGTVDPIRRRV